MNPYIIGGAAAVFAVMSLMLKSSYEKNGELEVKLEVQAQETQECVQANESGTAAIASLQDQIEALTATRAAEAAERERVLTEREQELARMRARADRLERERRDEAISNPDCNDLLNLSVDQFCPDTAQLLRQRSIGAGGDGD